MGLVGALFFDCQFGRNQGFNAAGNLFAAAIIAGTSHFLGSRAIFYAVALLVLPTIFATLRIKRDDINLELARGGCEDVNPRGTEKAVFANLAKHHVLLAFLGCAFLFHFANAAMLPQLGELLAHGSAKAAAPFMGACVAITQIVMLCTAAFVGRYANRHGRKGLLLLGFGVLPIRAVLYTVLHAVPALLAVQILDGVANSIFGVVSILVIADRTRGTGRFNLAQGALPTAVGSGAALSNAFGGILMEQAGYRTSFLALGGWLAWLSCFYCSHSRKHHIAKPNRTNLPKDDRSMPGFIIHSLPFSPSHTVSWIHIGDLHMTRSGEQNEIDLGRIVDEINAVYSRGGVDFVFIPGDIADDGSSVAYEAVRRHLDRLALPWCGIVGDHDVHEESFRNFRRYISEALYSRFSVGPYRFLRLNAFSVPKPDSFSLDIVQMQWLERELQECKDAGDRAVLLLHCYPSDLKAGGNELKELLRRYPVLLVDMGHTHYNEISNDGSVLYSATRSTGQIEEGPVGYSVTTIDGDAVSWHFVELDSPALVAITSPQDERLVTDRTSCQLPEEISIRVKTWASTAVHSVRVKSGDRTTDLTSQDDLLWEGKLDIRGLPDGSHELEAIAVGVDGGEHASSVQLRIGPMPRRELAGIDQENAIGEWAERGLLGTQLGPNKNGKKW